VGLGRLGVSQVRRTWFERDGEPEFFAGTNAHQLVALAGRGRRGRESVRRFLRQAKGLGLNALRLFASPPPAYGVSAGVGPAYLVEEGRLNEGSMEALDYVLAEAADQDIQVLLSLENYWDTLEEFYPDAQTGVDIFVEAASRDPVGAKWWKDREAILAANNGTEPFWKRDDFYTHPLTRQWYKDYVRALLARTNSVSGVRYADDTNIFAWELLNEPRCEKCAGALNDWITEMAAYVKSLDARHMETPGVDGFYSDEFTKEKLWANPAEWSHTVGQDFMANHASKDIDFAALHLWPDNWGRTDLTFQRNWIMNHVNDAEAMGKPLLVTEFGKAIFPSEGGEDDPEAGGGGPVATREKDPTRDARQQKYARNGFMESAYEIIEEDIRRGGPIAGSLFWNLYGEPSVDIYAIHLYDKSSLDVVESHVAALNSYRRTGFMPERSKSTIPGFNLDVANGRFSKDGEVSTLVGAGLEEPRGLCLTADGETLFVADAAAGAVYRIDTDSGRKKAVKGSGTHFQKPTAVGCSADGKRLVVADAGTSSIWAVNRGEVSTLVPKATRLGWLGGPMGVSCVDRKCSEIVISDSGNNRFLHFKVRGQELELLAGSESSEPWEAKGYVDGNSTESLFNYAMGVSVAQFEEGGNPRAYIASSSNCAIRSVVLGKELGGLPPPEPREELHGASDAATSTGISLGSLLGGPSPSAAEPAADASEEPEEPEEPEPIINRNGTTVQTVAGDSVPGSRDSYDITGEAPRFSWPRALTSLPWPRGGRDGKDTGTLLLVADTFNHRVRAVDAVSQEVWTVAGSVQGNAEGGVFARSGDPAIARFDQPSGIAASVSSSGRRRRKDTMKIYVSDLGNKAIRVVEIPLQSVLPLEKPRAYREARDAASN